MMDDLSSEKRHLKFLPMRFNYEYIQILDYQANSKRKQLEGLKLNHSRNTYNKCTKKTVILYVRSVLFHHTNGTSSSA